MANKLGISVCSEDLNDLPAITRENARKQVFEDIVMNDNLLIMDSHYSIQNENGNSYPNNFEFGIPDFFVKKIDIFVLLQAPVKDIYERRKEDGHRRRILDMDYIKLELATERNFADYSAIKANRKLHIIDNVNLCKSVKHLEEIIK